MSKKCANGKEEHHIIPKALGGTDDKKNIKCLTKRQHDKIHREGPDIGETASGRHLRYDKKLKNGK